MKTKKAKHTPVPWTADKDDYIRTAEGIALATVHSNDQGMRENGFIPSHEGKANATFIVRACNAHEDLVAACKAFFDPKVTDAHARIMADKAISRAETKGE